MKKQIIQTIYPLMNKLKNLTLLSRTVLAPTTALLRTAMCFLRRVFRIIQVGCTKCSRVIQIVWNKTANILIALFVVCILTISIRGVPGNPNDNTLNSTYFKSGGPFELSPESGRFALTYSLIEDHSFSFSIPVARFVTPDLGYWKGKFVSLFAPGVSLLTIPGYLVGKYFQVSQVGTYSMVALFAFMNFLLIKKIAEKLGASRATAILGGITFLFATPAFAYAVNLYEHQFSTFFILICLFVLLKENKKWWDYFIIWFMYGISVIVDYPNFILLLPIGITTFFSLIKTGKEKWEKISFSIKPLLLIGFFGAVIPLLIFMYVNVLSYGSPFRLAGSVPYIAQLDAAGNPVFPKTSAIKSLAQLSDAGAQSVVNFFQTRNLLNGFYIHFLSPDRGMLYFTPVIFVGIVGAVIMYKKKMRYMQLFLSIIGVNILLYSMWGDPWGGWAFGSRYLIPTYAILAIFVALALTRFGKKWFVLIPFWLLLLYSIAVNTLGALTTSTNPPEVQILALEALSGHQEKYTYMRNWDYLTNSGSKSFIYYVFADKYVTAEVYFFLVAGSIGIVATGLLIGMYLKKYEK